LLFIRLFQAPLSALASITAAYAQKQTLELPVLVKTPENLLRLTKYSFETPLLFP
jgi:hypothetical protein